MVGIIIETKGLPKIKEFVDVDVKLVEALTAVFADFGLEGMLTRVEFVCGTPPVKPPRKRCYRWCTFGPDDRPICTWVCY